MRLRAESALVVLVASLSFPVNLSSAAFVPLSTRSAVSSPSRVSGRETVEDRLIGVPPGESFCGERERARSIRYTVSQPIDGSKSVINRYPRTVSPSPSGFPFCQDLGFKLSRPLGILLVSFIAQFSYPIEELANICAVAFHSGRVGGEKDMNCSKTGEMLRTKANE